ncbi:MAG: response regulator receiver protein [Spirochaetes bacterium]|nr:MAG: response regulator receiver protein [Spirochaetota bacterium]
MSNISERIKKRLKSLSESFWSQLPKRLDEMQNILEEIRKERKNTEKAKRLHLLAHKLYGAGATFGNADIAETSRKMEVLLEVVLEKQEELTEDRIVELDTFIKELNYLYINKKSEISMEQREKQIERTVNGLPTEGEKNVLLLGVGDRAHKEDLIDQLGYFGFSIKPMQNATELQEYLQNTKERKQPVIVETSFLDSSSGVMSELSAIKKKFWGMVSFIFISKHEDFDTRLRAVRAGGDAFFLYPIDITRLIDRIESLTDKKDNHPFHILIVDDDPEQVSYYALVLQQAGMITSVASDPKQVVKVLIEAKPELILMDMYMPGCKGPELASIIRQQEAFVSIPIVFLSVEKDTDKQLTAIQCGGDDFLTKPIKPEHLIASITNRAERTRSMRYLMERDSLTALLNHSNLKEQLAREVMRSRRTQGKICFAMIDIDRFKSVNDTYGHITGDRVIKGLSRLLKERLRSTDIIGRYGGEEFGVILLNTDAENAERIMNEIRKNFSHIKQQADNGNFFVTFSCGIAAFPDFSDPGELSEAADRALYEAKETGRNRVVIARKT